MKKLLTKKNILLLFLFFVASVLRFYNLENTAMFLGDQGRDAIIVKRIVKLEHFPAIGPPSSIGQVYLGPFYYYLIAPFLLIFNFNPVGLAFAVGFYSLLLSLIIYVMLKNLVQEKTRIIFLFFLLFSPILIEFSRFSWNPNLLPYFSFLSSIVFVKLIKNLSFKNAFVFGSLIALTLQLHYSFLFILPSFLFGTLLKIIKDIKEKKSTSELAKISLFAFLGFLLFISPLIIFDLRHNFLNLRNFIKLAKETSTEKTSIFFNFSTAFKNFSEFSFSKNIPTQISLILSLLIIIWGAFKKDFLQKILFWQIMFIFLAISYFNFRPIPHYFGSIYLSFYFLLSELLRKIYKKNFFLLLISLFLLWLPSYKNLLSTPETPQIKLAKETAQKILPLTTEKYQLIALPPYESTNPFRYFLEIWNKKPLEENSSEIGDSLIVVCYSQCPDILANPQWQIASFPNKKIDKIVKFKNFTIVKIINEKK